jgi:hypothetical protein
MSDSTGNINEKMLNRPGISRQVIDNPETPILDKGFRKQPELQDAGIFSSQFKQSQRASGKEGRCG